jgi:predicted metal-dependent peptidase
MSTLKTASESAAETKSESENENGTSSSKPMNKKYPMSAQALENIYNAQRHGNHSRWIFKNGKDGKIDKNIANALEQKLSKQLIQAANRTNHTSFSALPNSIQTIINKMRDELKPKVDWKRQLKIFSTATGRTEIYHTVKRISKRFGTRPGIRIKKFKNLAVVIDTSGSIDDNTLIQFFKEIDAIYRNGAQVQIIECDAIVQRVYAYNKKTAVTVQGGGETNYDPAFTYINSNKSLRIDGCIYLTDGYAPEPTVKPRCKLLYVITPMGIIDKHLKWGRIIRIKNDIDFSNIEVIPLNF